MRAHSRWRDSNFVSLPRGGDAVHARHGETWRGDGARVPGTGGDRGEGGTKKGQMAPSFSQPSGSGHAPTESEHLPLLPRSRAQENHRLLSREAKGPSSGRHQPAVGVCRGSVTGPVSYFVSFPSAVPRASPAGVHPFPLSPRRGTLQDFQFWQMARAEQKDHPLFSSALLFPPLSRRSFVEFLR